MDHASIDPHAAMRYTEYTGDVMAATYYPAVIDRSASGFGISFPDFPGCIAGGDTAQDAAVNGEAALAFHLDNMRADGDAIPAPSSLDDIEPVEGADDVARVLVRADMPGKFVRVQVTLDENLLGQIDRASHNRSGFLADAARAMLARASESPTLRAAEHAAQVIRETANLIAGAPPARRKRAVNTE